MVCSEIHDSCSQRISELEERVKDLEGGLHNHKIALESVMRTCEALGGRLTENYDEFVGRMRLLENRVKESGGKMSKN